jgi:hypothetical protein
MSGNGDIASELLEKYGFIPKICALRFCTESTFEDFVQEGILSILDRSSWMSEDTKDVLSLVIRNCLRAQQAYYLRFYKDVYPIFEHPEIERNKMCCTLFGESVRVDSIFESGDMDFYETKEIVRSFADNCSPRLKSLIYQLYRV